MTKKYDTTGKRVGFFLLHFGLTPTELAEKMGESKQMVNLVVNDVNAPGYKFLKSFTKAIPIANVSWILTEDGEPFSEYKQVFDTLPIIPKGAKASDLLKKNYLADLPQAPNPHNDNCTLVITASDSAMRPYINTGNLLFCSETKLDAFFDERRICLVAVGDDLYVRQLNKVADGYSLNARDPYYKAVVVPADQITAIWYVEARHGSIKGFSSRGKK